MPKTDAEKAAKKAAKAAEEQAAAERAAAEQKAAAKAAKKGGKKDKPADDGWSSGDAGDPVIGGPGQSGDLFSAKDWDGALVLFTGQRLDLNVTTSYGPEPEVPVGRVVILDPKKPSEPRKVFPSTSVFGKALLTALREAAEGRKHTAGRLASKPFKNGNGWVLEDDADARKTAIAYLKSLDPLA